MAMALATPTILPVPTRLAVETISASKAETAFSSPDFSPTTRMDSPSSRSCTNLDRTVKYSPAAISRMISR